MIKKIIRFLFLLFLSLSTLYLILISTISILIGLGNTQRPGFWMPILCGGLILILASFLIRLIVYIIRQARAKDKYLSR
jgi:hypothetical protein